MGLSLLATTDTQIIRVVEALYKQTPGYTFLTNFRTYVTENSIDDLANALASSFSSQSDAELAATVTANLGLTGDAQTAGNSYLEGQFASNPAARGKVVLDAMNLLATMESDATFGAVAASFNANTVASLTYSTVVANTAVLAEGVGQSFALTTKSDGSAVAGTTKDDVYTAIVDLGTTNSTLTSSDNIAAGAGADSLTITATGSGAESVTGVTTSGLEAISLTSLSTGAGILTIDAALMAGVTSIAASNSTTNGAITFTNLGALAAASLSANTGALTLTYGTTVVAGTTDTQALTVSGTNAGTFTADGIETIAITTATSAATATVASNAVTNITVSGDQNLTLAATTFAVVTDTATVASTIDASALTGNLTATISDTSTVEVKGGSGDDTINMAALLETNDKIDGGAGTDTLTMANAALTTQFTNVSNVEKVAFNASAAANALDISKLSTGVATVELDIKDDTDGGSANITGTVSNYVDQVVNIKHTVSDADDDDDSDGVAYTITSATDTAADAVTVTLDGIGAGSATIQENWGVNVLNVATFETVNISSDTNSAITYAIDGSTVAKAIGKVTANTVDVVTATNATSAVITGAADLTLTDFNNGTALTSLDASALAGKFVATIAAAKTAVKMGQKDSTITFDSGTLNNEDSVVGGAGTLDKVIDGGVTGLTATTGALTISAVETIQLTTSGNNTLDLSAVTGATTVAVTDNVQTITGLDIANTSITLGISTDAAATASEIDVTAADATGTSDVLNVIVNNEAATTSIIDADNIETLALTVNVAGQTTTLDLTTFTGANITVDSKAGVTATAGLALGTLDNLTTSLVSTYKDTVSASFANADSAITFSGDGTDVQTITGSAYVDTFTVGKTAGITHVLAGGAGEDTLNLTANAGLADVGSISAIQTVNVDVVAGADVGITTDFTADVDDITITGGNSLSTFDAGTVNAALETINAAAFTGNLLVDFGANTFDNTVTVTGGALTTDAITTALSGATTFTPTTSGVEIITVTATGANTTVLDTSATTGLTTINVTNSVAATFRADKLAGTEAIVVKGANNAASIVEGKLASASGETDSLTFHTNSTTTADGWGIKTDDIETVTIKAVLTDTVDLSDLAMTTAGKVMTLNATGATALTVSATNADVTTIDASGMATGGSFVQTGRSATAASTYTGSAGADTFIMMNKSDVLDGAAGTNDTLDINKAFVLGGIEVDLSSTTNQVSTFNGSANAAIQKGFENVDVSGVTGSFGAQITAISTGSTITGTANADVITGGAGADIIHFKGTTDIDDVDTIAGGAGANSIVMDVASTAIDDADFANTTLIQTFTLADGTNTAVFGTNAAAAGIVTINGGTGADTITTGTGDQTITGGLGVDTIITGAGIDLVNLTEASGTAADVLVYAEASGDVVTGWDSGGTDTITLTDTGTALNNGSKTNGVAGAQIADGNTSAANTTVNDITQAVSSTAATAINTYQASATTANLADLITALVGSTGSGEAFDGGLHSDFQDAGDIIVFTVHSAADTVAMLYTAGGGAGTADSTLEAAEVSIIGVFDSTSLVNGDFADT